MFLETIDADQSAPSPTRRQEITADIVKSSGRTIQILEYFSDMRRDLTICEISRGLGYPQSSTAALLHTLVRMGYMTFNRQTRTYKPSGSIVFLGSWVDDRLAHGGPVLRLMEAVAERTQDMVLLGSRNGLYVKYVHIIQPRVDPERHCANGTVRPLVNSGAAPALLSGMLDAEIKRIALRSNASNIALSPVNHKDLVEKVEAFRRRGYQISPTPVAGIDMLTITLPGLQSDAPLSLSIGGPSALVASGCADMLLFLQATIQEHLGHRARFALPKPDGEQKQVA
jgi:DNA-binding IclR family transcriptional regulator